MNSDIKEKLESKLRDELNIIARKLRVDGYRSLNKDDLISAILKCNESCVRKSLSITWWDRHHNHVYGCVTILAFFLTIVFFIVSSIDDPSSQQVGTLRPKYQTTRKGNEDSNTSVGMNQDSQIFTVEMSEGVIVQPLGRYAPFSIRRSNNGLFISAIVHSLDGKIIAKIQDNEWVLNPNNYFRRNFDRSALEIIDEYDIPILQVEYIDENRIKMGGIFHLEEKETLEVYPDFPSTPKEVNPRATISFRGGILIIGKYGLTPSHHNTTPEELRTKARIIKPWFDYSKAKKLGIRK